MKYKPIIKIALALAIVFLGLFAVRELYREWFSIAVLSAENEIEVPEIKPSENQRFINRYAPASNINDELRIIKGIEIETGREIDESDEKLITFFVVHNHSNEGICFSNQGFNLKVYKLSEESKVWSKLDIIFEPVSDEIILPPNLTTLSSDVVNIWEISYKDIKDVNTGDILRIYIQGKGVKSGIIYGAYLDLYAP